MNCSKTELRSCVKVEVAVLGSPSLIVHTVSVDTKSSIELESGICIIYFLTTIKDFVDTGIREYSQNR